MYEPIHRYQGKRRKRNKSFKKNYSIKKSFKPVGRRPAVVQIHPCPDFFFIT